MCYSRKAVVSVPILVGVLCRSLHETIMMVIYTAGIARPGARLTVSAGGEGEVAGNRMCVGYRQTTDGTPSGGLDNLIELTCRGPASLKTSEKLPSATPEPAH